MKVYEGPYKLADLSEGDTISTSGLRFVLAAMVGKVWEAVIEDFHYNPDDPTGLEATVICKCCNEPQRIPGSAEVTKVVEPDSRALKIAKARLN